MGRNYCADIWTTWFLIVCLKSHYMFILQNNMKTHIDFRSVLHVLNAIQYFMLEAAWSVTLTLTLGGKASHAKGRHKCEEILMLSI